MTPDPGWQPDGSYVPCPECAATPKPYTGPGTAIRLPGVLHHRTCPLVPDLTPSAELLADLQAIRDNERRAWAEVQNVRFQ